MLAEATGRPVAEIILQPAALTLWEYYQWIDARRIERHIARLDRFDAGAIASAAAWDGVYYERQYEGFLSLLRTHPDPAVERQRNAQLIARAEGIFGKRVTP